jgi:hypothetical protein
VADQLGLDLEPEQPRRRRAGRLRSFHARAHVQVEAAILGEVRAERQEDRVLEWMRTHRGRHTPWAVAEATGIHIVSTRRAISNLTERDLLRHWEDDLREAGPLGGKSATWEAK